MPYMQNKLYREIPFCAETPYNDFYIYVDLKDVSMKYENHMDQTVRCRTIGILQSLNGRYYLTDFNSTGVCSTPLVQVSVMSLRSPPHSTVIPYPVQIFGSLQWKNRPVIFAKTLQVLSAATALRLKIALSAITSRHLAKKTPKEDDDVATSH